MFWSISESCHRKRSLLFVQQMRKICNVTQYEVAGEGECFFQIISYYMTWTVSNAQKSDILAKDI